MRNFVLGVVLGMMACSLSPARATDDFLLSNCLMKAAIVNGLIVRGEPFSSIEEKARLIHRAVRFW